MFNGNPKHTFPDFIPIVPTENILKCHLLIQFYHVEENSKIKEKAIDTAVIPLSCISGNNNTSVEVELFSEAGKVSKDANVTLQTPKKSEGLSLQITIPPFYFPPQNMATALTDNFDIPSLSGIDESYADLYIIPLFCRLIKKRDSKVLPTLVQLLITFGDGGRTSLRKWLFNHFDPQTIGDDFPTFYPEAIKAFCHEIIEGKIETTIIPDFSTSLPLILDIMQIVFSDGKLQSTVQDLITINNSLLDLICFLLTEDIDCNSITESLGLFFFHNLSDLGNEEIVRFVYIFLRTISKVRPIIAHPMSATRVQWIFLSPLSLSKHFLINMTNNMKPLSTNAMYSPYSKLTSQFLLSTQQCFGGRDPDTFALCAGFLARLLSNLDEICYSIRQRIAFALFPLIDLCSNHFESPLFMSNKRMQIALIPFVLFLIKNSEQKQLLSFFHSLSISFKCHFISFLKLTGKIIIDTLDVIKPTYECPQINLNLLDLLTHIYIKFLFDVKSELGVCMNEVIQLIEVLLCRYQPTDNYKYLYLLCDSLFESYPLERNFIIMSTKLIMYKQAKSRALSTALIINSFKQDYNRYEQVNVSTLSFIDEYATILLENKVSMIPMFKEYILIIKELTPDNKSLKKKVSDRMDSALSIADIVEKQKSSKQALSIRCQQLMSLADENMDFPNMRLKWLSELVRINIESGDYISAFVSQLHCTCLIATVVEHRSKHEKLENKKKNERLPKPPGFHLSTTQPIRTANNVYDYGRSRTYQEFFFIPSVQVETKVKVDAGNADAEILLSDFNENLLIEYLNSSVWLCEEAQLYYTLRSLSSMALRVLYQNRDYGRSKEICSKLSNYLSSISTGNTVGVSVPLSFFMVERRQGGKKDQRIYCCKKTETIHFVQQLKNREGIVCPTDYCDHHEECKGDGICLIQLEPSDDKIEGDEAPHSWDKFRSVVSINKQSQKTPEELKNPIKTLYIETSEKLPFYHQGVSIKKIEIQEVRVKELCVNTLNRAFTSLDQLVKDFDPYLSMPIGAFKDSPMVIFGKDLCRYKEMLYTTLQHPNCARDCLSFIKQKYPELLEENVSKFSECLVKALKQHRRAVNELLIEFESGDEIDKIKSDLDDCTEMINKFCKDFEVDMIDDQTVYEGIVDPMSSFCAYENEYE